MPQEQTQQPDTTRAQEPEAADENISWPTLRRERLPATNPEGMQCKFHPESPEQKPEQPRSWVVAQRSACRFSVELISCRRRKAIATNERRSPGGTSAETDQRSALAQCGNLKLTGLANHAPASPDRTRHTRSGEHLTPQAAAQSLFPSRCVGDQPLRSQDAWIASSSNTVPS